MKNITEIADVKVKHFLDSNMDGFRSELRDIGKILTTIDEVGKIEGFSSEEAKVGKIDYQLEWLEHAVDHLKDKVVAARLLVRECNTIYHTVAWQEERKEQGNE